MGAQDRQEKAVENQEKKRDEQNIEVGMPQPSCVLLVDLHCSGCAKKIVRSFSNLQGVEDVEVDMVNNKVTVKGSVDPLVVCGRITQKTKRSAEVLSPLPRPQPEPTPSAEVVASETKVKTVEINVHMHCEPCAAQLHRKIRRMPGVESAVMDVRSGKVSVTGTVEAQQLVEYIYKRTGKHAQIVVPEMEVEKEEAKPVEEKKITSDSKGDEAEKTRSPPPQIKDEQKKEETTIEESKPVEAPAVVTEKTKHTVDTANGDGEYAESLTSMIQLDHPLYLMDPMPHPHLFSDENPNACCIS